ncbi:hypothetical protein CHGG_10882 [Chaetomium globosum CBS 148.51]|uniref:Amidohydrolase-related domain-containing protein n=1 Tax=Chaetomium globosum (strain ATCC 6205 / CBS 148.51 / DSM 1962 / NBRC 6347 / NRRL 1970) TaxID=306901 RepID=Q2GMC2_CHAGB|nr:uncharacterized protein CHGG_10882 [Chaetomium globosum CBS 148.51]EAQ83064.1 hypothetical protein CHGG_10882 [Chaetomium globosum CBS 148.51]
MLAKATHLHTSPPARTWTPATAALQVVQPRAGASPPTEAATCRAANDKLAEAVRSSVGRLAGFAVTPMGEPREAGRELRLAVRELGQNLVFYDKAEGSMHTPRIMFHKTRLIRWRPVCSAERLAGQGHAVAGSIGCGGRRWRSWACRCICIRIGPVRGMMGRYRGGFGEAAARIQALSRRWGTFERDFETVYRENIWITTSGNWSLDPLRCILANTKLDHILYSVDYPFLSNESGLEWIKELEKSGLVDEEQLKAIAYGNAEKLLGVKLPESFVGASS